MKGVYVALLAAVTIACSQAPTVNYAWWVKLRIEPKGATYLGVPLANLSLPLKRLTLLSCEQTAETFTSEQCAEVAANDAKFVVEQDFNGDGVLDSARVGVAETMEGTLVSVMLIGPVNDPSRHQVMIIPGNRFSALFADTRLSWYFCMECDNGAYIEWRANEQQYETAWGDELSNP